MIAPRKGPRAGCRAHQALVQLHRDGGQAKVVDWMKSVSWPLPMGRFSRDVVDPLIRFGLIRRDRLQLAITDDGRRFLGMPVPEQVKPVITPAPYSAPMRPLTSRPEPLVVRPGAFDYRDIPSRQGGVLVPYKSSMVESEAAHG